LRLGSKARFPTNVLMLGDVMYAEMMSAFGGSLRNVFLPVQKMNQTAIAHAEKIVAIQLESLEAHTNLGIGHLKAAAEVNGPSSFMSHLVKQGKYATKVGEQVVSDVQKLSQLGGDFVEQAQSVAQEEARAIGSALSETEKGSAKKVA
jgi:phasin family protein